MIETEVNIAFLIAESPHNKQLHGVRLFLHFIQDVLGVGEGPNPGRLHHQIGPLNQGGRFE
jgi:hypothetical protein